MGDLSGGRNIRGKSPDPLQGFTSLYVVNTVVNTQADTETGYSTGWLKKVSC